MNAGVEAKRMGTEHASIVPYQTFQYEYAIYTTVNNILRTLKKVRYIFRVKDGWMTIGCGNDRLYREFCQRIGIFEYLTHCI